MTERRTTVGSLNGPWALLLRIALATYPLVLAWSVWVTKSLVALEPDEPRYSALQAQHDRLTILREIEDKLAKLPPPDWRERILAMENTVKQIELRQVEILSELKKRP